MRLKCIKLAGFKSFVDPTTVTFPSNLCAVVGPNGCGKSNIIDAVRWVMGESSAKNLRGESMTDVIFNGSGGRKPVGQATIELVFDNSDGTILGEYASYAEISIKRKVTRDGLNLYYLNGNKCRRRDITDIFLGTGLGPRSYAIIEQGMISRLIEARPEDLRIYVEEAAGISKYKERRRDTESRMRRTQENLERLKDIREELERQLSRLERQAQSAEKYTQLKKEERQLKAQLHALKVQQLQQQLDGKQQTISQLELLVEAGVTEQVHQDSAIETHRARYLELGDEFNKVQGRFYALGADISRLEQNIAHAQDRERQLRLDLEQTQRDCRAAQEHLDVDQHKVDGWQVELLEMEPELALWQEREATAIANLDSVEDAMQQWQQAWDAFNSKAAEARQQAEVQQARLQYLDQVKQRLLERLRKLNDEHRQHLASGIEDDEFCSLEEDLATLSLEQEDKALELEAADERIQALREAEAQQQGQLSQGRQTQQMDQGRLASLQALQDAALGQADAGAAHWLVAQGLEHLPRLAERIQVAPGWDLALELVLGNHLQALCVAGELATFADESASLSSGEVILLQEAPAAPSALAASSRWPTLASQVTSTLELGHLLNGIYIAADTSAALAMLPHLQPDESVITQQGVWFGPHWLRLTKESDATAGVLARHQALSALQLRVDEQLEALEDLEHTFSQTRVALRTTELQREDIRKQQEHLARKHNELRSQLSAQQVKQEQHQVRRTRLAQEQDDINEQLEQEDDNSAAARAELEIAIDVMAQDTLAREGLLATRDALKAQLDHAKQDAHRTKDASHQLAMTVQSVKTQLSATQLGSVRLQDQVARLSERRQTLEASLLDSGEPVELYRAELEDLLEQRLSSEENLAAARTALDAVESAMRNAEKQRLQAEQGIAQLRGQLERERLEAQTLSVQAEGLKQQLIDDQFDLSTVLSILDAGLQQKDLEESIAAIAGKVARLGPINLAAIEEYQTESERKRYLDEQNQDLQEALDTLENAIRKIDRETRTRFKETFDAINSGLQELFPKVFGGGHAYLELTGEDMLDTGITIMARPPGKRNSTIHLLSGGEKALTAIALVFSIFRLNPAPFCMLDEVDAPLDDANVGRYARMVEEMSSQVQFIYITHNKIAMEMAHQLMGVTMHEPGVSRMVTVDVEEAAQLAAS